MPTNDVVPDWQPQKSQGFNANWLSLGLQRRGPVQPSGKSESWSLHLVGFILKTKVLLQEFVATSHEKSHPASGSLVRESQRNGIFL